MICAFGCKDPPVVVVNLSKGCVGRRDDRSQHLCLQHLVSMDPIEDVEVVRWLTVDGKEPEWQS